MEKTQTTGAGGVTICRWRCAGNEFKKVKSILCKWMQGLGEFKHRETLIGELKFRGVSWTWECHLEDGSHGRMWNTEQKNKRSLEMTMKNITTYRQGLWLYRESRSNLLPCRFAPRKKRQIQAASETPRVCHQYKIDLFILQLPWFKEAIKISLCRSREHSLFNPDGLWQQ